MTLKRAYFFPKMYKTVRRICMNCSLCLRFKAKKDKSYIGSPLDLGVARPWETVAVDHFTVGHSAHLKSVYLAVLIAVDVFSSFVVAENVRSLEGKETSQS